MNNLDQFELWQRTCITRANQKTLLKNLRDGGFKIIMADNKLSWKEKML